MKPEIKQRIEQIRHGEVPDGYKKSKLGIIPEQWHIQQLQEIASISSGSTPNRSKNEYWNGDIPWVTTSELSLGYVSKTNEAITAKAMVETRLKIYSPDTLLMAMYGQGKTRGTVAKLNIRATINQACAAIVLSKGDPDYIFYVLQNAYEKIRKISNSGNQENLNAEIIKTYSIFFPSIDEQQKIAEMLSTQDNVIELYEKKIGQLQLLKKICLRKMFPKQGRNVPEVRFPSFTEPWEQRKISTLASGIHGGGTPTTSNETYWNGNIPWIQSSDLREGELFGVKARKHITITGLNDSATQLIPEKSIAIVTRVGVGKLALMLYSYTTSQDFLSLSGLLIESYFAIYGLYQMLQGELLAVQGTSIKGMSKKDLLFKSISVPKDKKEQKMIGTLFRNLDHLITLHQRRLDEEKRKKKSLMQLLLTGIVRV